MTDGIGVLLYIAFINERNDLGKQMLQEPIQRLGQFDALGRYLGKFGHIMFILLPLFYFFFFFKKKKKKKASRYFKQDVHEYNANGTNTTLTNVISSETVHDWKMVKMLCSHPSVTSGTIAGFAHKLYFKSHLSSSVGLPVKG